MNYKKEDILKIYTRDYSDIKEIVEETKKSVDLLKKYYEAAINGKLKDWRKTTKGKLALILIYDQAPRYLFDMDNPRTWDTDELARELTTEMHKTSEYEKLSAMGIMFAFFPYHHSEDLQHQKIAKIIFKELHKKDPKKFEWIYEASKAYNKIIERFGRFPHRNKPLGRESTKQEKKFLEKFE